MCIKIGKTYKMRTCDYVGCNNKAGYRLTSVSKKPKALNCCPDCAPVWVKDKTIKQNSFGLPNYYKVEKL